MRRGAFRMSDHNLLELLDAPKVAVLANRTLVESGDAERLCAHLRVLEIEPPEIEVWRAVWQQRDQDWIEIVDEEKGTSQMRADANH